MHELCHAIRLKNSAQIHKMVCLWLARNLSSLLPVLNNELWSFYKVRLSCTYERRDSGTRIEEEMTYNKAHIVR